MSGSTLGSTLTVGLTLGSDAYPSPLTITPLGAIDVTEAGATALYATIAGGYVLNAGSVAGAIGQTGSPATVGGVGGAGVAITAGSLVNTGRLSGGMGGTGGVGVLGEYSIQAGGYGGAGGAGASIAGGALANAGTIVGGGGGTGGNAAPGGGITAFAGRGGAGGAGVQLIAGTLSNAGLITGGAPGLTGTETLHQSGAGSGVGVYVLSGELTNTGTITGGAITEEVGNYGNGIGVLFAGGGTLVNAGSIGYGVGTSGANLAVYFRSGASRLIVDPGATFRGGVRANTSFSNVLELAAGSTGATGTLTGTDYQGFATVTVDPGAAWVVTEAVTAYGGGSVLVQGSLTNQGFVTGGAGQAGSAATANAYGTVEPGQYGSAGGDGIVATGSVTNLDTVRGGAGGAGGAGNAQLGIVPGANGATGGAGAGITGGAIVNQGTILGGSGGAGGATPTGISGAAGQGGTGGAGVVLASGTLTNDGTIIGGTGGYAGSDGAAHGVNGAGGAGVYATGGSLFNFGTILGGNAPVNGKEGGIGVAFAGGGTLVDSGLIAGGYVGASQQADAVYFGTGAARLVLDPGAAFGGSVVAVGRYANVVELASAATTGTLSGVGGSVNGFGTIAFDPGASWVVNGAFYDGGVTISGFGASDTIALPGFVETGSSFGSGALVLSSSGASQTIDFAGSLTADDFAIGVAGGETYVELAVACFAAGTRIAMARGEVAVERLAVGDVVRVVLGDAPAPVVWIGHRVVDCRSHPDPRRVWPVRVRAGAFGPGRPKRTLFLSPDHAVYVNGVLIPVKHLINGTSIAQAQVDSVTYYHVELAEHDVLLAEGLPVESYLDTGDRANFANSAVVRQFPDFSARAWDGLGCAPLIVTGRELTAARRMLAHAA